MRQEKYTESEVAAGYSCKVAIKLQTEGSGRCMELYKTDSSKGLSYGFEKFLSANF